MAKDRSKDEDRALRDFLSKNVNVRSINLDEFDVGSEALKLVPKDVCERHRVIPVNLAGSIVILAMADPRDIAAVTEVAARTGLTIEAVRANEDAIRRALARYY